MCRAEKGSVSAEIFEAEIVIKGLPEMGGTQLGFAGSSPKKTDWHTLA